MRRILPLLVASLAVPVALYACANDDTPPGPKTIGGVDSSMATDGGVVDAAPEAALDAPIDQDATVPVRCTQAELDAVASAVGGDYTATAAPIPITFPTGPTPSQYTNQCIKVKVGATVTFTGSFSMHPLERNGGDVPSPIPALTNTDQDGGSLALTMTTAATYGYQCNFHPGLMFGAIQVVP